MSLTDTLDTVWAPRIRSVLRIVTAWLFLLHGSTKLLHMPYIERFENVPILSLGGIAGVLELFGGTLLLLGLWTRLVAFILSGEMAFAYFIAHATTANWLFPLMNNGEPAVLFCFIFLYLAAAGGGAWSIDRMMTKR